MTLKTVSFFLALCDNCGASAGSFYPDKYPGPHSVTVELVERFKWTAFDNTYHCYRCPPLCVHCGADDVGCDCLSGWTDNRLPPSGDAAYVSREPAVIATVDGGPAPALTALLNFVGARMTVDQPEAEAEERGDGEG